MRITLPSSIRHDQRGFETFVRLYAQTKDCFCDNIEIDMGENDLVRRRHVRGIWRNTL